MVFQFIPHLSDVVSYVETCPDVYPYLTMELVYYLALAIQQGSKLKLCSSAQGQCLDGRPPAKPSKGPASSVLCFLKRHANRVIVLSFRIILQAKLAFIKESAALFARGKGYHMWCPGQIPIGVTVFYLSKTPPVVSTGCSIFLNYSAAQWCKTAAVFHPRDGGSLQCGKNRLA